MRKKRTTQRDRIWIQSRMAAGATDDEILESEEVSPTTLWRWRKEVEICGGVRRKKVSNGHELTLQAGRLIQGGATSEDLVRQLGISWEAAKRQIAQHQVFNPSRQEILRLVSGGAPDPEDDPLPFTLAPEAPMVHASEKASPADDVRRAALEAVTAQIRDPQTTPERLAQIDAIKLALTLLGSAS